MSCEYKIVKHGINWISCGQIIECPECEASLDNLSYETKDYKDEKKVIGRFTCGLCGCVFFIQRGYSDVK